ncbi:MAG: hypothetical protein HW412_903 [Bacteroidetes bacterium]|nr:hypothetical protein [Bacteroidota bacterium]
MRTRVLCIVCSGLVVVGVSNLYGQGKKEPPHRQSAMPTDSSSHKSDASLPKIDLPEFLITGNESIDLPDVGKTSAEGQWVDDSSLRKPNPGAREASVQLGGVQKEQIGFPSLINGYRGKALVGYGSYNTPYFDGWFGNSSSSVDFLLKAGYRSSGGHVANADYRNGHASLAGGMHLGEDPGMFSGNRLQAHMGMRGNSYSLYGSANPALRRSLTSVDGGVAMSSTNVEMLPYSARFAVQSSTLEDASKTGETSLGFEINTAKDLGDVELKGDLALWRSFYSAPSSSVDPYFTQLGASAGYRLANSLDVRGGLALFLFRGSDTKTLGRLYPRLGVSWYADERLTVYAKFEPVVKRMSLDGLVASSPYVVTDVELRHAEQFINFSLGAEAEVSRMIRSRLSLNYSQTDNTPVFVDPGSVKVWSVSYGGTTRVVTVNGEVYADITEADNLGASFSIRSNRNTLTGSPNPYFPSFLSSATYQHRFLFALTVGSTLQVVGRQSVDQSDNRHLPAFVVLNLKAEYVIVPRWNVMIVLSNLFDQKQTWWDNYAGLQRTVSFGTSFAW